ncbi:MAG TPA: DNA repair protein RecN [Thermomicrobiales bacterium]|nr:DNA repair protein RecN [Thermomicrobiales bacterium]
MLLELSIRNFAIIEASSIQFADGLNVLTGETGAGKSILLDAMGAVLGARVSSELVRTGEASARVEAVFACSDQMHDRLASILDELGIEPDEDSLVLSREIMATGRSTARINGRLSTATALARVGGLLVDIHGQSDHLAILRASEQRQLLDRFAGTDDARAAFSREYSSWRDIRRRLLSLTTDARDREQRVDLLRYQLAEIEEAALVPGEEEQLIAERDVLRNADRLRLDAQMALQILADDETTEAATAILLLRGMSPMVDDLATLDPAAGSLAERANELLVLAEDLARDLRDYGESVESDEAKLLNLDERVALLQSLKRKYGSTVDEILAFAVAAREELEKLTSAEYDLDALTMALEASAVRTARKALELSAMRQQAAVKLARLIEASVAELHMGRSELTIAVETREEHNGLEVNKISVHVDDSGIDQIEFRFAPNAGETLRPISRIASGGETARLMLAIKSILSDVDLTPTLVFDEIDVGVGGRIGQVVGEKLWSIGQQHQVIVVTHLPQIASFAGRHLKIEKSETTTGRTVSIVRHLEHLEREVELAAMIDGLPPGEAALLNAHTMLERSRAFVESSVGGN